jgi:hypothetical protein
MSARVARDGHCFPGAGKTSSFERSEREKQPTGTSRAGTHQEEPMKKLILFVMACTLAMIWTIAQAEIPKLINYQGMLTDDEGIPIDGTHTLTFRIYDDTTGAGTLQWSETQGGVQVDHGLFNVVLGKSATLNSAFDESYWLEVEVDGEVMPRIRMTSVPYAYRATRADTASVAVATPAAGGWTDDGSVVRLTTTSDQVGIGLTNPNRKLYIVGNTSGLSYPLKLDNPHSDYQTDAVGILFSVGGDGGDQLNTARGKGGLVYQYTDTWNRGSFHFLQGTSTDADVCSLNDIAMTIKNNGHVGIGTSDPNSLLELKGTDATTALNTTSSLSQLKFQQNGTNKWTLAYNSGSGYMYFYDHTTKAGTRMVLEDGTGNVGVGIASPSARLHAVGGDYGIKGKGNTAGAFFEDAAGRGHAYLGYSPRWRGIEAKGDSMGAAFGDNDGSGFAYLGYGNRGVHAKGTEDGGYFEDLDGGSWARVGATDKKVLGSGSVSFVQNHPEDNTKVIVYTAVEGDEAATYTRGTARLVAGEARVPLGETFKWVTNPDLGLTAHVTPREECEGVFVASLTTTEMVVKELRGGTSDAVFDYIVYGLRIGFEETSIVQEKAMEAYIPSMKDYRELYRTQPHLRQYNALERFRRMYMRIGRPSSETGAANALRDAIHEFDPAIDGALTDDRF